MNDTKRHLLERLPGSFGLRNGHGFALGESPSLASLPVCEAARAGEKRRIPGGAGVADTEVTCQKDDADDWAWVEGGSGSGTTYVAAQTLLNETPFSAVSAVSLDNVFSATYESYVVIFRLAQSADASLQMRLRVGGTDESGANTYYSGVTRTVAAETLIADGTIGRTFMTLALNTGGIRNDAIGTLVVSNPFATDRTVVDSRVSFRRADPAAGIESGGHARNATTSYDGFTLFPASGTITGTIRVYGIQDSIGDGATGYTDEAARDAIGAALVAGANTTITVSDVGDTITIASTGGGSSSIADILMLGGM